MVCLHLCHICLTESLCRSESEGRFLYIFKDALSEYSGQAGVGKEKRPVPPCISQNSPDTVQVVIEVWLFPLFYRLPNIADDQG